MSADVSVVCRWCVGGVSTDALADVLADALVGSDSLPLPTTLCTSGQSLINHTYTVHYK